jgi:hypothetical protein
VAGGVYVLLPAGAQIDTALAGMTGVTGWILPLLFVGMLALTHRLPVRNPPDLAGSYHATEPPVLVTASEPVEAAVGEQ